jgi:hypothetical protein
MHLVRCFIRRSYVFTGKKEISVYNVHTCHSLKGLTCSSLSVTANVFPVQKICLANSKTNFLCIRLALVTILPQTRTFEDLPHDTLTVVIAVTGTASLFCLEW